MGDFYGLKKNNETFGCNDATARSSISLINEKIPSVASSNNKLVDTSAMNTALAGKVDKVAGKGLSTNDYSDEEKSKVTSNAEAIEAMVNVNGACNILNSSKYFIVNPNSGVTFTVNADGSVTINGTATANTAIVFVFDQIDYDVIMKGSSDDIVINFDPLDGNWQVGTEGQIAHGLNINGFSLNVNNGNTINNVTVYPMLYDARLNPTGYVPYAMTNRELTDAVGSLPNLNTMAKNNLVAAINETKSYAAHGRYNSLYDVTIFETEVNGNMYALYATARGLVYYKGGTKIWEINA